MKQPTIPDNELVELILSLDQEGLRIVREAIKELQSEDVDN